jgi:hypothetical protein
MRMRSSEGTRILEGRSAASNGSKRSGRSPDEFATASSIGLKGCHAGTPVTADLLSSMKSGKRLVGTSQNMARENTSVPPPIDNFRRLSEDAAAGAPVFNSGEQAVSRPLMPGGSRNDMH